MDKQANMEAARGGSLVRDLVARLHALAPEADARQLSAAVWALSRLEHHPGKQVRGRGARGVSAGDICIASGSGWSGEQTIPVLVQWALPYGCLRSRTCFSGNARSGCC